MESKPGFDDEFQPKPQGSSRLVRSIGWMMSVAVVGGVALSVTAGTGKYKKSPRRALLGARQAVPVPKVGAPLAQAQARDPFVVVAAPEIDAKMVVVAPAGIDEAMVFNPDRDDPEPGSAPAQVTPLVPVPGGQPGQVPYFVVPPGSPKPATPP
jgi:hypothetical protein